MNGYLVDTNVPSELTRERPNIHVEAFLRQAGGSNLYLSVMTIGEISQGIAGRDAGPKRTALEKWLEFELRSWFEGRILPVTEAIAERWGHLAAHAKRRGMVLPVVDGIILATAVQHDLTLVTRNVKDFSGLGAEVLNPWEMKIERP